MRVMKMLAAALLAGMTPAAALAQSAIQVPATASWKHAQTGLILPSKLAGLLRSGIADASKNEIDVSVQYGDTATTAVTLYIFRPALMNASLWFDRSETQIQLRDIYGGVTPLAPALAFAPAQSSAASALRRTYAPHKGKFKSTALAVMPLGEWLVAVRISSVEHDPTALDAKLSDVIAGLKWPASVAASPPAAVIVPCVTPLAYDKKAKLKKPDMTDSLMGALFASVGSLPSDTKETTPVTFCREGEPRSEYAVYRADPTIKSYVIALGDAGLYISVTPTLPLDGKKPGYGLSYSDLERTLIFPSFDRLPSPEAAIAALKSSSPTSSTTRGSKEITINAPK